MMVADLMTPFPPPALRGFAARAPNAIFMGASTGGVDAICAALSSLALFADLPVVVVLHLRAKWAPVVARQAERLVHRRCVVARDGERLSPGIAYFACGGENLRVVRARDGGLAFRSERTPSDDTGPSVDVLFRSAATALGPAALGVVLTGMGEDGLLGARAIVDAGGSVLAQDEASSVVWGMPGAVAKAGLASALIAPAYLGATLHRHFSKLHFGDPS